MISGIIEVDLIHLIVHLISKAKFGDGLLETWNMPLVHVSRKTFNIFDEAFFT